MNFHSKISRPLLYGLTGILWLVGLCAPVLAQVVISEFMANNVTNILQDEDGDNSDWLELFNTGGSPVDLTGWHLTDSKSDLVKWTFPTTNLPAGEFLIVFASGKDKTATNLHANFSLSSSGEYLALVHPDGTNVEDEVRGVSEQFPNISYGIQTHGTNPTLRDGQAGYLIYHTPGAANTCLPANHPLYSDDSVAQIELMMPDSTWNWLKDTPDKSSFQSVDVRFRHGDIDITVTNAGIQCRGNSSLYSTPRSFNVIFNANVPGQKLLDLERLNLNANVNDPSTARPKLVEDMHRAAHLPVSYANHVAVVISNTTYNYSFFDAIRNNTQPVDDVFLDQQLGTDRGNLYKCLFTSEEPYSPASLETNLYFGTSYTLTYSGNGDPSYTDLTDFIHLINDTSNAEFPNAIMQVFDVDGFLKRLALDVLTANWDSYWGNANNYYLFHDTDAQRWTYIPYDFDNVLGISWDSGNINWSTCDIYNWPQLYGNTPLAERILDVPEFKKRYSFYMKEMLDEFYTNDHITPAAFHTRSTLTNALPFDTGSVTNMKALDRDRYQWDDPKWSYSHFWDSYAKAQWFNTDIRNWGYRDYGITNFTQIRGASALSQLGTISNIAPILSEFKMKPSLPRTNDLVEVSIEAFDDSAVTNVSFVYSFDGGSTQTVEMVLQTDGSYETNLPASGTAGTLVYFVRAFDDDGQSTTHPYGGSGYAASVEIESDARNLVISEIQYHPTDPTPAEIGAGFTDEDDFEFVELHNIGESPMDLTGFTIQGGIVAILPSVTLTNGEYAVVVANTNAFHARYTNAAIRILCVSDGKLSNSGETLRLEDAQGGVITSISYSDGGSWPGRADGDGSTLEVIDFAGDFSDSGNWRSSSEYGGTPGAAGTGPDNRVVINEVLTHTDLPLCDTIELFNTTERAIDLSGWALSDATSNYTKYVISTGTVLAAYSYISFNETNDFNTSMGVDSNDFALSGAHGDDVFLMETDALGRPIRFVDRVEFDAAINSESFGRWPNGSGRLVPMSSRTFGAINSGPRVGPLLINEIMYNPPSSNDSLEFVEIYNPTVFSVDLTRWELDGGVDYQFPTNELLAAGATLTVTSFNPENPSNSARLAEFRSTYGLSTNTLLVGGYDGQLDNGGERLRLLYPDTPPIEETNFYPMLLMDEVRYDDDAPWPLSADGGGASLSRLSPAGWGDDATNWTATLPPTPGSNGVPPDTHSFTVVSAHGSPYPAVGTHDTIADMPFTNSVSSLETVGGARYLCTGWMLESNAPLSGTTNIFSMTLTNDATLTWLWNTNVALLVSTGPGGSVLPASGWHPIGSIVDMEATASNDYTFAGWTGDTNTIIAGDPSSTSITVTVDTPVSLTAHFEAVAATYYVYRYGSHIAPYTNWATASTSLHEIVAYVPSAATVIVAAAVYTLPATLSISNALHLKSASGPDDTILYGGWTQRVLLLSHSNAIVEGFTVTGGDSGDSSGGGVRIDDGGRLINCIIDSNFTDKKGGGVAMIGGGELRNCLFYFNYAGNERGGGLYTYTEGTSPLIENCTFTRNTANEGGGIYLLNAATLRNSIVWGNDGSFGTSNLFLEGGGQTIEYTDSGPIPSGPGNAGADPRFVDAADRDFHLAPDSPAINAGISRPWMANSVDLDGRSREIYGTNDLGAFEGLLDTVDSDSDRVGDWQESCAGTDPFSASSVLDIQTAVQDSVPGQFVMSWSSATGRTYRIAYATNLLPPALFNSLAYSNISATPPANSFTGLLHSEGAAYYRIEVE